VGERRKKGEGRDGEGEGWRGKGQGWPPKLKLGPQNYFPGAGAERSFNCARAR